MISTAWAQGAAAPAATGSFLMSWLPLILIFAVFYFLIMRPQAKRQREHDEMVKALKRGDKIVTSSGLHGEISKVVDDDVIEVKIAENTVITLSRYAVANVAHKAGKDRKDGEEKGDKNTKKGKKAA